MKPLLQAQNYTCPFSRTAFSDSSQAAARLDGCAQLLLETRGARNHEEEPSMGGALNRGLGAAVCYGYGSNLATKSSMFPFTRATHFGYIFLTHSPIFSLRRVEGLERYRPMKYSSYVLMDRTWQLRKGLGGWVGVGRVGVGEGGGGGGWGWGTKLSALLANKDYCPCLTWQLQPLDQGSLILETFISRCLFGCQIAHLWFLPKAHHSVTYFDIGSQYAMGDREDIW